MSKYSLLNKASLTVDYLDTNSTTHEFLFGALAELVDNARDANANNLHIYTEKRPNLRGGYTLSFLDDGQGMDPKEVSELIQFGKSYKRALLDRNLIGQYGNGLKSGSMRIGNDMILFTKKNSILSICFLSKTFFEGENLTDIIVPLPSFHAESKEIWFERKNDEMDIKDFEKKHKIELEIILKHSPYQTKEQLFAQFDKIQTSSGTLVTIYNLKLKIDGESELDFESNPNDIQMTGLEVNYDRKHQQEHKSFREYVSILYLDPRMKIYIQNKKVRTRILDRCLYKQIRYTYASNKFKKRAENEAAKASQQLEKLKSVLIEAESKIADFSNKNNNLDKSKSSEYHKKLTILCRAKNQAKQDVEDKQKEVERKTKTAKEPKKLEFIFGINLHNRNADGLFLYNCNRLIMMFEHTKLQQKDYDYRGIVGIVNIPYLVLEPTHNKQGFQEQAELSNLIKTLNDHMEQYPVDSGIVLDHEFWKKFGYSREWNLLPLDIETFPKIRMQYTKSYIQCDNCLKWRFQNYESTFLEENFPPEDWSCEDSNDASANLCNISKELQSYPLSEYKPRPKTSEEIDNSFAKTSSSIYAKKIQNDVIQQVLRRESTSSRPNGSEYRSSRSNDDNTSLSYSNKKRKSDNEDYDSDSSSVGSSNIVRSRPKTSRTQDHNYSNSYVNRIISSSTAKKSKASDALAVVTESLIKNEPNNQNNFESNTSVLIDRNTNTPMSDIQNNNSSFREEESVQDIKSQLKKQNEKLKTLSEKYKELLIKLASTYNETSAMQNEIFSLNLDDLISFSLNDFMNNYEKGSRAKIKYLKKLERERIESEIKRIVDGESANQILQVIYPK